LKVIEKFGEVPNVGDLKAQAKCLRNYKEIFTFSSYHRHFKITNFLVGIILIQFIINTVFFFFGKYLFLLIFRQCNIKNIVELHIKKLIEK
jgi:hypothetical protein